MKRRDLLKKLSIIPFLPLLGFKKAEEENDLLIIYRKSFFETWGKIKWSEVKKGDYIQFKAPRTWPKRDPDEGKIFKVTKNPEKVPHPRHPGKINWSIGIEEAN